jgi:hypothetical protein
MIYRYARVSGRRADADALMSTLKGQGREGLQRGAIRGEDRQSGAGWPSGGLGEQRHAYGQKLDRLARLTRELSEGQGCVFWLKLPSGLRRAALSRYRKTSHSTGSSTTTLAPIEIKAQAGTPCASGPETPDVAFSV